MNRTVTTALSSIVDTAEGKPKVDSLGNPVAPCIGQLAGGDRGGNVLVQVQGGRPQSARLVAGLDRQDLVKPEQRGREVLLVFEQGDSKRPIITHLMEAPLEELVSFEVSDSGVGVSKDVTIDGKKLTLEAHDEIVLKCGKGSISIRKDGKIVVKGANLLSRSSGSNRIKGGSVSIN